MNPIVVFIAIIWVIIIIVAIKAFRMTPEQLRDYMDVPRPDRDANKAVDVHGKAKEHAVEAQQQSRGRHSTRNIVIITTIVVIAIVIVGNLSQESPETIPSQPTQPYIPRYTADQVIAVVRSDFPTGAEEETFIGADRMLQTRLLRTPTQISVKFVGGTSHVWEAVITCPDGYVLTGLHPNTSLWIVYFWETDGKLYSYYVDQYGESHRSYWDKRYLRQLKD